MRIALVHDDLIQHGGAEKLLLAFHEIWPNAPVYTSVATEEWKKISKDKNIDLKVSFMQKLPFVEKLNRFYSVLFLHVLAFESFDFSDFDVVISISARYSHGIITKPSTLHVCYMNSPGRMFWEPDNYFKHESFGRFHRMKETLLALASIPLSILRMWDFSAAQRVDFIIANSLTPQLRIKKYYKRDSVTIYPFVEKPSVMNTSTVKSGQPYFLIISRLVSWKRIDLAINACEKMSLKLKVVGTGPCIEELKSISNGDTEFLGYVTEELKHALISGCTALINPQLEDFGITPLEAMIRGKPVVAFGRGGALETVVPGKTGELFYEQNVDSLIDALNKVSHKKYLVSDCIAQALKFEKKVFVKKMKDFVNAVYLGSES